MPEIKVVQCQVRLPEEGHLLFQLNRVDSAGNCVGVDFILSTEEWASSPVGRILQSWLKPAIHQLKSQQL